MKKKLSKFTAIAVTALTICSVTAFAEKSSDAPVMESVTLYSNVSAPDGKVTVGVEASDMDGIKRITVYLKNDATGKTMSTELKKKPKYIDIADRYSGTLTIPKNAAFGEYQVESVVLVDELDNKSRYFRSQNIVSGDEVYLLENAPSITIKNSTVTPFVEGCSVAKNSISAGDFSLLTLNCGKNGSEIDKATVIFKNYANGRKIQCALKDEDLIDTRVYRKKIEVPNYEPAGTYELYKVTIEDKSGHEQCYCDNGEKDSLPLSISEKFTVKSKQGDLSAPQLEYVSVGSTPRKNYDGDKIEYQVRVKVSDDVSGIDHITVRFKNFANDRTVTKVLREADLKSGVYSGWMEINEYEPSGTFVLENVGLTDKAKNYQAYCLPEDVTENNHKLPLSKRVTFVLNSGRSQEDEEAPILQSVSVTPTKTSVGNEIKVTVKATDDISGVDKVDVQFKNYLDKTVSVRLHRAGDAFYGTIKNTANLEDGTYRLTRVSLKDRAENRRVYYESSKNSASEKLTISASFTLEN